MSGAAIVSPSVARNRGPIGDVLQRVLPARGTVLEIASGSGEHGVRMAAALPGLTWQPSDHDPRLLASISAHRQAAGLENLLPPLELDCAATDWPISVADAMVAINLIHIAPWTACEGLMAGAGRLLPPGGVLYLYGPFRELGVETAPSNLTFDADLKASNPAWGLRELDAVVALAGRHGLTLVERLAMPANNLSLVFRRVG